MATLSRSEQLLASQAMYKPAEAKHYWALLKPRVMALVTFTCAIGLLAAPGHMSPLLAILAIAAIALGGGAAGAFNMWYEAALDARMERTKGRPIPAGKVNRDDALAFAIACGGFSLMLMGLVSNWIAAAWLLASMVIYTVIYTVWLKPRTWQNIVWGGASGALPPIIGWTAATGGTLTMEPVLLFLIIFLWTPPHFWALSHYKHDDYHNAGIPMLPVVKGLENTRQQIVYYCVPLVGCTVALPILGYSGIIFMAGSLALGAALLWNANRLFLERTDSAAKRLFGFSILYLFAIFLLYGLDKLLFWKVLPS
jgi:protoheme IX farnesyltransferase